MAWSMASANASQVRVGPPFLGKNVRRLVVVDREIDVEKTAAANRRRCSNVVAVLPREEIIDS